MPHVYRRPVYVNGRRYLDGTGGIPFPAREVIERWGLTGLVVLANQPRDWRRSLKRKLLEFGAISLLPKGPRKTSRKRLEIFGENLQYLRSGRVPYLIVWTDDEVEIFERDQTKLRGTAERAGEFMSSLLERAGT